MGAPENEPDEERGTNTAAETDHEGVDAPPTMTPSGDGKAVGAPETRDGGDASTAPDDQAKTRDGGDASTTPDDQGEDQGDPGREEDVAGARRHGWEWPPWRRRARIVGFAIGGALLGLALAGRVEAEIGPFDSTVAARPSLAGQTTVHLAPLGTIVLDTHDWPLAIDLSVDQIGLQEAEQIAEHPQLIEHQLGEQAADDIHDALVRLAVRCTLVAIAGAMVGALVAQLSWRSAALGVGTGSLLVAGIGAGTVASFDTNAVAEPRYTGLLTAAPAAVGDIETIIDRYGEYRAQLSDLVGNVVTLYLAAEGLPTFQPSDDTIQILHVSDVHLNPQAFDLMEQVRDQFGIDAIVDTGDLVDWGTVPEDRFVAQIGQLEVPYVYVRGNHDSRRTQTAVAEQPNAVVLDGDTAEVAGLRLWGIGDPRYTPHKDQPEDGESEHEQATAFAPEVADQVAAAEPPAIDLVLIHDERAAADLGGEVPLVLAGHTHEARQDRIEPRDEEPAEPGNGDDVDASETTQADGEAGGEAQEPENTLLLVEGSTGGAGLRGLQGEAPEPLVASVLYFDPDTHELLAYDRITVQGFGETGATIERHVLARPDDQQQ